MLKQAASLRQSVRDHMSSNDVLEVCTPALSRAATTDPHIHSFQLGELYLHTSPELPMKRLLAAHQQDIYQLCTVFRDGETGRYHNREFTLLEWYRIGFDHRQLMSDISDLMQRCCDRFDVPWSAPQVIHYTDTVSALCELPFESVTVDLIEKVFHQRGRHFPQGMHNDLNGAMDILMDEFVIANFPDGVATFIVDYPSSQAALARTNINDRGVSIAERFELYFGAIELANGFNELNNAQEQRHRFESELASRQQSNLHCPTMDEHFLAALEYGLPDCAGVAMGMDRLLMVLTGSDHMQSVMAFPSDRA